MGPRQYSRGDSVARLVLRAVRWGGSTFASLAPHFDHAEGADIVPDVAMMWQAVADGWIPPTYVTCEEYHAQRHAPSSALRGFVAVGASFSGKWFGGYAHDRPGTLRPRSYSAESYRAVLDKASAFAGRRIVCRSFSETPVTAGAVVYSDPPYAETQGYAAAGASFDHAAFWATMARWREAGITVFVSEAQAPDGWTVIAERTRGAALGIRKGAGAARSRVERIFA